MTVERIKPTEEQVCVVDTMRTGENFVVDAGAGAGKTRTLIAAANVAPGDLLYTAFNRDIIDDGKRRFRPGVHCLTTHKLAYNALGHQYRERLNDKARQWAREKARLLRINHGVQLSNRTMLQPTTLARLAANAVNAFSNSDQGDIRPWHVERPTGTSDHDYAVITDAVLPYARKIWADLIRTDAEGGGQFTFSPNHLRKIWALSDPVLPYRTIMLDEAQDTAGVVGGLLMRQDAQIVAIGDPAQAINEWAGAVSVMENWPAKIRLRLSRSFRFGEEIADEANRWLAQLGDFRITGTGQSTIGELTSPRAVLCRTNGGTAEEVLEALTQGKKVALAGRNAADQIRRLARACQEFKDNGCSTHEELVAFSTWQQVEEFAEEDPDGADLKAFVKVIADHGADVVEQAMDNLSPEQEADETVSTMHRSKGREWASVKIGQDSAEIANRADRDGKPLELSPADTMLFYVAVTRAQRELDLGGLQPVIDKLGYDIPDRAAPPAAREQVAVVRPADDARRALPPALGAHAGAWVGREHAAELMCTACNERWPCAPIRLVSDELIQVADELADEASATLLRRRAGRLRFHLAPADVPRKAVS